MIDPVIDPVIDPGGGSGGGSRRPRVAVLGGVSWNLVVDVPRLPQGRPVTLHATAAREGIGSTGAGKSLNLARLGFDTRLHALLGEDELGARCAGELAAAGVRLTAVADPAGTERHVNLMDPEGQRVSVFVNGGTADPPEELVATADLLAFVEDADHVWVNLSGYTRRVLPELVARGVPLWVDLHDWDGQSEHHRAHLEAARYVFLSDENLEDPLGLAAHLARDREIVVVTHGPRGATALRRGHEPLHVPPVEATVADPNGAGDAFTAGVMYGRSRGWSWPRSLEAGALVAARCVASPQLADPSLSPRWLEGRMAVEPHQA